MESRSISPPSSSSDISARDKHIADRLAYKKALDRLGLDPSREKIKERLGVRENELRYAETERQRNLEALIEQERAKNDATIARDKAPLAKAFSKLGIDPSKEKVKDTLGISDKELQEAEQQKLDHVNQMIQLERKRADSRINKYKLESAKALEQLGYDPSKEKVMLTLGIDDDQLQEAEEKKREVHEEILEKQRGKNDAKITSDKIANAKAFEKLGVDLSKEKLIELLGLTESDFKLVDELRIERLCEVLQRDWSRSRSNRRLLSALDENKSSKALGTLGYDPSKEKVKSTLGLSDSQIQIAATERAEAWLEIMDRQRGRVDASLIKDRPAVQEALERLGYDPSLQKVKSHLGMDENDIKAAKQQQWESAAAVISKEREKNDSILNRDVKALHSQKALNQLGYNPSDEKLKAHLGLTDQTLQAAKAESTPSSPGSSPSPKTGRRIGIGNSRSSKPAPSSSTTTRRSTVSSSLSTSNHW